MRTVAVTRIGTCAIPTNSSRPHRGRRHRRPARWALKTCGSGSRTPAICGSDPHLAEGFFGTDVPIGLGHEISGVVEALGDAAHRNGLQVGDRVAGNYLGSAARAAPCRAGQQQFYKHIQDYNRPGMAETVTWHESQVYRLPDDGDAVEGMPAGAGIGRGAYRRQDGHQSRRSRRGVRRAGRSASSLCRS